MISLSYISSKWSQLADKSGASAETPASSPTAAWGSIVVPPALVPATVVGCGLVLPPGSSGSLSCLPLLQQCNMQCLISTHSCMHCVNTIHMLKQVAIMFSILQHDYIQVHWNPNATLCLGSTWCHSDAMRQHCTSLPVAYIITCVFGAKFRFRER